MEKIVNFERDQQVTDGDLDKLGLFGRTSLDRVVRHGIEPGLKFTGFAIVTDAPTGLTIGAGALWADGKVYFRDDEGGVAINLINNLPLVQKKIVTIIAWGQEFDSAVEPRTFLVDADTLATEGRATPTENWRQASIDKAIGVESASPEPPALNSNTLAIAHVTLTPAGIESVTMVEENRLVSVRVNANLLAELMLWRNGVGALLDTLTTEVAELSNRLRNTAKREYVDEIARTVGYIKDVLNLPDDYSAFGADRFLDDSESDIAHVDYLATIEEGLRFPPASSHDAQLGLLNNLEARVRQQSLFLLPTFTDAVRIQVSPDLPSEELSISQFPQQTLNPILLSRSRLRTRYGNWLTRCTNGSWFRAGHFDAQLGIFRAADDTIWEVDTSVDFDGGKGGPNHHVYRYRQVWQDIVEEPYWSVVTTTVGIAGSVVAQTFLNGSQGWLTAINVWFARKGGGGDVKIILCECSDAGTPNIKKTIATATLLYANILLGEWTDIPLPWTALMQGRRYAFILSTAGAHFLSMASKVGTGNRTGYPPGTFFTGTDGEFFQGDVTRDLAFRTKFALFTAPRQEVQLLPLELSGGIHVIDILAKAFQSGAAKLTFQVLLNGAWMPLDIEAGPDDHLTGLPPLLQFRAVFQGTPDMMPGLGVGSDSRVVTHRARSDFTHVSTAQTSPTPVDQIIVDFRLEYWDAARHTFVATLLRGAGFTTEETADTVATIVQADPPEDGVNAVVKRYTFNLGAAISTWKFKCHGTTNNVLITYHGAWREHVALVAP